MGQSGKKIEQSSAPFPRCGIIPGIDSWLPYKPSNPLKTSAKPSKMAPHATNECYGNCSLHPLLRSWMVDAHVAMDIDGMSWGAYFAEAEASTEPFSSEAHMADMEVESKSFIMKNHAEKMAVVSGKFRKEKARKIQKPCKWLYCDESAPKSQWRRDSDGKLCAPSTGHVASECWAWEYLDPKTKVKKAPHTCPYLHPGEEGWCSQWLNNKNYDPMASAVQNRFCALKK